MSCLGAGRKLLERAQMADPWGQFEVGMTVATRLSVPTRNELEVSCRVIANLTGNNSILTLRLIPMSKPIWESGLFHHYTSVRKHP